MTAHPSPGRWRVSRWILGAILVLSSLLAPVEWPQDPGLLGHDQAAAQTGVVFGTPGNCPASPAGWGVDTSDPQLCRIEVPACPFSPYDASIPPTQLMQIDSEYPEFCREPTVTAADPLELQARCRALLDEYFVVLEDSAGNCIAMQFRSCTVGARIDPANCRATVRRTWTCDNGLPRNEFNTCYIAPQTPPDLQPVCAQGAPSFVAIDCETYVGADVVASPTDQDCATAYRDYRMASNSANGYWCSYDSSRLDPQCHLPTPPPGQCNPNLDALCLKRLSRTGGCQAAARKIRCNELREVYRARAVAMPDNPTLAERQRLAAAETDARGAGCEPCPLLPFSTVPDHCSGAYTEEPVYRAGFFDEPLPAQQVALEYRINYEHTRPVCGPLPPSQACRNLPPTCERPTAGYAESSSTHFSGAAVVNSAVMVHLHEVPTNFRYAYNPSWFRILRDDLVTDRDWSLINLAYAYYPPAPGVADTHLVRTQQRDPFTINARVGEVYRQGNLAYECVVLGLPAFRLFVTELWPDHGPDYLTDADGHCLVDPNDPPQPGSDAEIIRRLFGDYSLDWWCQLTADQRRSRTVARGLQFLPDLTAQARIAELEARAGALAETVDCSVERQTPVWCRWTPTRAGYYQLAVGGAWEMRSRDARGWKSRSELSRLRNDVAALDADDRDRIRRLLEQIGCGRGRPVEAACTWSPQTIGLNTTLTDILPTGDPNQGGTWDTRDPDYLWQLAGDSHRFGGVDLRVEYRGGRDSTSYTETEDFGVIVHEVRVSTVKPTS